MASSTHLSRGNGLRKSILDLAPLELECMNMLWPLGEGTVRQVQQRLARSRPRAYTTIMTIMDRLARKGIVSRHKVGRAYLYRPNLTAEQARAHAVEQVVEVFFNGSAEALAAHLASGLGTLAAVLPRPAPPEVPRPSPQKGGEVPAKAAEEPTETSGGFAGTRLDESLL